MELSDAPRDEVLIGSRIGQRLSHATLSRKRSEGDELLDAVDAVLVIAVTCHAPCAARQRGNMIAPRSSRWPNIGLILVSIPTPSRCHSWLMKKHDDADESESPAMVMLRGHH